MGPNQSIIWCLTSTGHGAAAWITHRKLETSYFSPDRLGQLEHAHEHRRHELGVGDPVGLDQPQHGLGVELAHDDRRGTDPVDRHRVVDAGGVVHRRGGEVHARPGSSRSRGSAPSPAPTAPTSRCRRPAAAGGRLWAVPWCPTSTASPTRPTPAARRPPRPGRPRRNPSPAGSPPTAMCTSTAALTARTCAASSAIEASTNTAFASESSMT